MRKRRVHVLITGSGYDYILPDAKRKGAIEQYIFGISSELAKICDVDVFSRGTEIRHNKNLHIETFEYSNYLLKAFEKILGSFAQEFLFNLYLLKHIYQSGKKKSIDVIHTNNVFSLLAAIFIKKTIKIPVVCYIHNTVRFTAPLRFCDKVLANSEFTKSYLVKEKGLDSKSVSVIPIAIKPQSFNRCKDCEQIKKDLKLEKNPIILFVGRKCPEKGPQVVIHALPKILDHNPDVLLVLIGPDYTFSSNSSSYTEYLIEEARKLKIEEHVIFQRFVPNSLLEEYYCAADVFVCPSVWQEPFGTVVIEALACQKPVVASKVGAIPEIITNNENGLLVSPNNSDELAEAINYLLKNPINATRMAENGKKLVLDKFSFSVAAKKQLDVYEKLINKKISEHKKD